ncbi:unnamed protein product [Pseudo-nitzschia multistriata]|uniref:Pyridoxamine 5'-phosphate oxidase N-terminal domain-containing protein n=1 Tax=Pseudo-nitzschia multistriata TaxID=183589 RepID=A0A448ZLZ1_9STRA|nr:unnamed protein product [Pseudo-nitzschia multistriata]
MAIYNTSSNNNHASNASVLSIVIGTTFVVGTLSSVGWYYYFTRATISKDSGDDNGSNKSSLSPAKPSSSLIKPPFPQTLRDMLSVCRLAYLSTVDNAAGSSHLSLMRFTYLHDESDGEVVIMSTNRKTKKFDMLCRQNGVALLVHDFDGITKQQLAAAAANEINDDDKADPEHPKILRSITLNGNCRILDGSSDEERYRRAHLAHNPDYPQFIVGDDIAVLCIDVTSARICDLNDRVVHWNVEDAALAAATTAMPPSPLAETARV